MSYKKDEFENWIKSAVRPNGKNYSKETISGYISSLRSHASKLTDVQLANTDLFNIDSLSEFIKVSTAIRDSEDFTKINLSYHRIFSSALVAYEKFLQEKGEVTSMSYISFETWLKQYPEHKYTDATIKRYIRALQKAEEWFSVSLTRPILEILTLKEFNDVQTMIRNLPEYEDVNRSHGHGDFSAGMGAYQKYLKDLEKSYSPEDEPEQVEDPEPEIQPGPEENDISAKEAILKIEEYIQRKGFSYEQGLIANFYLSLKAKPFVILAGTSGTGKTRLVKLFAEAIGAKYKMVSVRPDWSDSSDLFGHMNLNGKFVPGAILEFIRLATLDVNHPYILCLDEMNLARVEYYLSDILSVIETRDLVKGMIRSDSLVNDGIYGTDISAREKYGELCFPQNFYIVGTVNMDETTFPFSKKVLDRANTIEFNYVDLSLPTDTASFFDSVDEDQTALHLSNSFLRSNYLLLKQCSDEAVYVQDICTELELINRILRKANAHVGYRVRDEIVFYLLNNKETDNLLMENEAFDNEILQKILPRIQGTSSAVKDMICELFAFCAANHDQFSGDSDSKKMEKALSDKNLKCKYRRSAEKLQQMVKRFEEDGFTSYWV